MKQTYKIGTLKLKNPFLLAPMLEPNDIAFRLLCKKAGASLTYTGMTNPLSKQKLVLDDKPALQLFCNSTENLSEFIKKYDKKVSLWDFNLGCPSKLAKKFCHGAYLDDLDVIEQILITIRKSTKKPVTIKLRKSPNALKILKIAEKYCDAIAIHPRTNAQGYSGTPDLEFAKEVKKQTSLPVIYSGNVNEKNAHELLEIFDFVMLGREAIGNPNIFARLTGKKALYDFKDYLKLATLKKYHLPFRQIKYQAMSFTKGLKKAKVIRREIVHAKTVEDIKRIYES